MNSTAFNSITAPATQSDADQSPEAGDDKGGVADADTHCADPCLSQQVATYRFLETFAAEYVSTDVDGYLKHHK